MNKQKVLVSMLIAAGFISPMAYATNGDAMMAVGAQSTALGGTGVAHFMGADSVWANPAMLGKSKGSEITGGVVMFMPKVSNDGFTGGTSFQDSKANVSYIPDVSYSSRMSDSLTYGVAMAGIAGMGVDYTDAPSSHVKAFTSLNLMQVVPTIAYNSQNYGVGISPVLQWGSLAISYNNGAAFNADKNKDQYTGYGFNLGGYYDVTKDLTVAAAYFSEIEMKYGNMLSNAGEGFGLTGAPGAPAAFGDTLTQPAQMKAGVSYNVTSSVTVTVDYKLINWAGAKGYKDYNWKDQNVVAIGAKYTGSGFWLGAGYNSADNPIGEMSPSSAYPADYRNAVVNFFNNMMFPAIVKESYTLGGG
ncbi:MAG TPA: outer membrane protein transport protein, partial [Gammaproteobacteria bacterium]|nr:outer membrane protein transport protein [Gammaproteobacteria bacterium]